jgi:hypothetical protein
MKKALAVLAIVVTTTVGISTAAPVPSTISADNHWCC